MINFENNKPLSYDELLKIENQIYDEEHKETELKKEIDFFKNGKIDYENLSNISNTVGKDNLVLDLSCRKKDNKYYIVTDRWQNFTEVYITDKVLDELAGYCDEFLIHAVDVEGKASGIEKGLAETLGGWNGIPVTYAGGISSFEDISELEKYGNGKLDFTIGSALDIFGGEMAYNDIVSRYGNRI